MGGGGVCVTNPTVMVEARDMITFRVRFVYGCNSIYGYGSSFELNRSKTFILISLAVSVKVADRKTLVMAETRDRNTFRVSFVCEPAILSIAHRSQNP